MQHSKITKDEIKKLINIKHNISSRPQFVKFCFEFFDNILSNKRNAPLINSYLLWNKNIRNLFCDHIYTQQYVIVVFCIIIYNFAIQLAFTITPKVCTPKFESHNICKDFSPNNKDDYF